MSLQIVQNQQLKPIGDKVPIDTTLSSSSENAISNKAVNDEITRINSDLTWKLVGSVLGSTPINIPASFHELHIVVKCPSANASPFYVIDHLINNIELDNLSTGANTWLVGGGAVSDTNHFRAITFINPSHTTINTANVVVNNQDFLAYTRTELYYR